MRKEKILVTFFYTVCCLSTIHAQAVIGSTKEPEPFSALELISSTGGLRYPQLTNAQISALAVSTADFRSFGLMVYNTAPNSESFQFYSNTGWKNLFANVQPRSFALANDKVKVHSGQTQFFSAANPLSLRSETGDSLLKSLKRELRLQFAEQVPVESLKVGKYIDAENLIKNIRVDTNDFPNVNVQIEFYPKVIALTTDRTEANALSAKLYATFLEKGVERQIRFPVYAAGAK
jgi:hypothetical protein